MADVEFNDVIRCSVRQRIGSNNDLINVYEFRNTTAQTAQEADVLAAVAAATDDAYAQLNAKISNVIAPVDIKVDVVSVVGGVKRVTKNVGTVLWGSSYAPAAAGDRLPSGVAALVKGLTGAGKIFAKKFIGGLVEADNAGDAWGATLLTALATFATNVFSDFNTTGGETFEAGVLSVGAATAGEWFPVSEVAVNTQPHYQRRRRPGVGS